MIKWLDLHLTRHLHRYNSQETWRTLHPWRILHTPYLHTGAINVHGGILCSCITWIWKSNNFMQVKMIYSLNIEFTLKSYILHEWKQLLEINIDLTQRQLMQSSVLHRFVSEGWPPERQSKCILLCNIHRSLHEAVISHLKHKIRLYSHKNTYIYTILDHWNTLFINMV